MQASEGPSEGGPPPTGAVESSKAIACQSILSKTSIEWCSLYCQTSLGVMKQMMRPWLWLGYSFRHQGRVSHKSMSSIRRSSFRSVIVKRVFASMHAWLSIGLFGSAWFIWLVGFSSRCLWVFLAVFSGVVALVCLHPSAVFMCMWMWWVCMCAGGILLAEVGSCLQSGSQQSPDLWPSHSRTATNRLRLLFSAEKPLPHLSWLHLSSFLLTQNHCHHPVC